MDQAPAAPINTAAQSCPHRWVLDGETTIACVLCGSRRSMTTNEIARIEAAQRAGAVFLKWPDKPAMELRRSRQTVGPSSTTPKAPSTSAVKASDEVPEGYIRASEYAALVGWEDKKVRKMARQGRLQAIKVGGNVYVKRPG